MGFVTTFKNEIAAQNKAKADAKEARRKAREAKGPLLPRLLANSKNIAFGAISSLLYLVIVYLIIMFTTLYLPTMLGVILASFESTALAVTVQYALQFFTLWMLIITVAIVWVITKIYVKGMKHLFKK